MRKFSLSRPVKIFAILMLAVCGCRFIDGHQTALLLIK
jgi:hypothetical protein